MSVFLALRRALSLSAFALALAWTLLGVRLQAAETSGASLRVMQLNVWQEGTSVPHGLDKICDVIIAAKADVVCFSEVRNYHGEDWTSKVVAALARRGQTFHGKYVSGDVGLVSRFPLVRGETVFDETRQDTGSIAAWRLALPQNVTVIVAASHLDYQHYGLNLIRGYNGGTPDWKIRDADGDGKPDPVTDTAAILRYNAVGRRSAAITSFLARAAEWEKDGLPVILCGDFNEGSHLDWTARARAAFGHYGVEIRWPCTTALAEAGFTDAWRKCHPDELAQPGFTWPAPATGKPSTSWAPKADERDRIDFVFAKGAALQAVGAWIVGPAKTYRQAVAADDPDAALILHKDLPWPSDHKAVLIEYRVRPPGK